MEQSNDFSLLRNSGNGDQKSFELLYSKYWYQLYVSANKVLKDESSSEDIIQEVFTSLWKKASTLEIENLNAYLYQAVKFQVAKKLRAKSNLTDYLKNINGLILESHQQIEDKLHYTGLLQKVDGLIGKLPQKCKDVFILSRYQHLTNSEIADHLGISVKTVENQINKAIKYLRANLDDYSFSIIIPLVISAGYAAFPFQC